MKRLAGFRLVAALVGSASVCLAQGGPVRADGPPSQRGAGEAQPFVSLQGRFAISLPRQVSSYSAISATLPEGRIEGDRFGWRTAEGSFEVSYVDLPGALASAAVFDRSRDNQLALNRRAKLVSERDISLAGRAGREIKIESPDGLAVVRTYLAGSRLYELAVSVPGAPGEKEAAALRVLDSFRLLSQAEVDAERQRQVAEAEPGPLPQEPAAPKLKTDAEDAGLRGRVKVVFTEVEDLSGTWAVGRRKPSRTEYYNELGNLTKEVMYDSKGNLFHTTVYGYVDGQRVSKSKMVRHEYDPPPVIMGVRPGEEKEKYDPRYNFKFSYKYDGAGRLAEEVYYHGNGKVWMRYVYNYDGSRKETLAYSQDGSLNSKSVAVLDEKGLEVEKVYASPQDGRPDSRYRYTYESFDAQGNWTRQTTHKWAARGGGQEFVPSSVTYRTITYY